MCDGYHAAGEDDHPGLEDEFLCEYVDGTMDPVVREVFEEYVRTDPNLQEHIQCLRDTRLLLCKYGCSCHAPRDLHDRLRRSITCDLVNGRIPFHILVADRLKGVASVSTAMAILVLIGVLGGVSVIDTSGGHAPLMTTAIVGVHDLRESPTAYRPDREPHSLLRGPRLTPRERRTAGLQKQEPLVIRGLEQELHDRGETAYLATVSRSLLIP